MVVVVGGVQGNESITQEAALLCTHGNVSVCFNATRCESCCAALTGQRGSRWAGGEGWGGGRGGYLHLHLHLTDFAHSGRLVNFDL